MGSGTYFKPCDPRSVYSMLRLERSKETTLECWFPRLCSKAQSSAEPERMPPPRLPRQLHPLSHGHACSLRRKKNNYLTTSEVYHDAKIFSASRLLQALLQAKFSSPSSLLQALFTHFRSRVWPLLLTWLARFFAFCWALLTMLRATRCRFSFKIFPIANVILRHRHKLRSSIC